MQWTHAMRTDARLDAIPYPRDLDNVLTGNLDEAAKFVLDRVAGHREPDRV
jgi:hypothetical protein